MTQNLNDSFTKGKEEKNILCLDQTKQFINYVRNSPSRKIYDHKKSWVKALAILSIFTSRDKIVDLSLESYLHAIYMLLK